jgi:hypothetical protein
MPRKPRQKPLPRSLAAIAGIDPGDPLQPHLGNVAALRARLLHMIMADDARLDRFTIRLATWEEVSAETDGALFDFAAQLLGCDAAVTMLPGWHTEGGVDVHLRKVLSLPAEMDATTAVKTALAKLLIVTRKLRQDAHAGQHTDEEVSAIMLHMIGLTAAHLVGETPA